MPQGIVRGKEMEGSTPKVHVETDEGIFKVVCPLEKWGNASAGVSLEVPDGDLEHPMVAASIQWPW